MRYLTKAASTGDDSGDQLALPGGDTVYIEFRALRDETRYAVHCTDPQRVARYFQIIEATVGIRKLAAEVPPPGRRHARTSYLAVAPERARLQERVSKGAVARAG
jgi:tRNA A37 N6-isopentenylltransferase MiaA